MKISLVVIAYLNDNIHTKKAMTENHSSCGIGKDDQVLVYLLERNHDIRKHILLTVFRFFFPVMKANRYFCQIFPFFMDFVLFEPHHEGAFMNMHMVLATIYPSYR